MQHLQAGHPPADVSHVARHDAKAFGLQLAAAGPNSRALAAVQERREDQSVAVYVSMDQQDCAADRVELDQVPLFSQVVQVQTPTVAPAVAIESWAAVFEHAVRLHDRF